VQFYFGFHEINKQLVSLPVEIGAGQEIELGALIFIVVSSGPSPPEPTTGLGRQYTDAPFVLVMEYTDVAGLDRSLRILFDHMPPDNA
jgi:hypothetical protein